MKFEQTRLWLKDNTPVDYEYLSPNAKRRAMECVLQQEFWGYKKRIDNRRRASVDFRVVALPMGPLIRLAKKLKSLAKSEAVLEHVIIENRYHFTPEGDFLQYTDYDYYEFGDFRAYLAENPLFLG